MRAYNVDEIDGRLPNNEMPHLEDEIEESARNSEFRFLQIVLEKYAKKNPFNQYANETK
jgi:hypothetical protein